MKADLLILNASELVTMSGGRGARRGKEMTNLGIINDGSLAAYRGKIVAVGKTDDVKQRVELEPSGKSIDARGKVVMPGFVDPHTHISFAGDRDEEFALRLKGVSYIEMLQRGAGILKTVRETRSASDEQIEKNTLGVLRKMLVHGTTTAEVKSSYGLNMETELRILRTIKRLKTRQPIDLVPTFFGAHVIPPEFQNNTEGFTSLILSVIPRVAEENLAEFCDVWVDGDAFSPEQGKRILDQARKYGMLLKVHADEFSPGGSDVAAELKTVSADHLVTTTEKEIELLARSGVVGILLPATPFSILKPAGKYADARKMIDAGLAIALGSDYSPATLSPSMQMAITLACTEMKMLPEEALTAATINAAHAANRADVAGSLEEGKNADILIVEVPHYYSIPARFGTNLVETVIKNGKVVSG